MSITSNQAIALLESVLFEAPTVAQTNAPQWLVTGGSVSDSSAVAGLAVTLAGSPEGGIADEVVRFYEGALGRLPAGAEVSYYVKIAEAGLSAAQLAQGVAAVPQSVWTDIASAFTHSPEFTAAVAADSSGVIDLLYHNVLGRTPAAFEIAYYQAQLDAGAGNSQLLQEFINSPEYLAKVNSSIRQALAGYGTLLAPTGGPTQPETSNNLLAFVYNASPAGAAYGTAPTTALEHDGSVSIVFSDTAALTLDPQIALGSAITDPATLLAKLDSGLAAHHVAWGVYEGNTYVVESLTGTPGPTDTAVIEVTGTYGSVKLGPAGTHSLYFL